MVKKFKNKEYEQIHVHTDTSKIDDKVNEIKEKLDALKLTSSSSLNDAANKNNTEVGYQLPTPTPELLKKIHSNNKHFMSHQKEKYQNCFSKKGKVLALEVEEVYKNGENVVIRQKGIANTLFDNVNEAIMELGLPPLIDDYTYNLIYNALDPNTKNRPFLESKTGSLYYVKYHDNKKDKVQLPYVTQEKTVIIRIYSIKNIFLQQTKTLREAAKCMVQHEDKYTEEFLHPKLSKKIQNLKRNKIPKSKFQFPSDCKGTKFILNLVSPAQDDDELYDEEEDKKVKHRAQDNDESEEEQIQLAQDDDELYDEEEDKKVKHRAQDNDESEEEQIQLDSDDEMEEEKLKKKSAPKKVATKKNEASKKKATPKKKVVASDSEEEEFDEDLFDESEEEEFDEDLFDESEEENNTIDSDSDSDFEFEE